MRCNEIIGLVSRNIEVGVLNDFLHRPVLNLVIDQGLTIDHTLSHSEVSREKKSINVS